jgi:uncharacterized protein YndB with AHSA1/START domain
MTPLFVDKSVEIDASADRVWEVLTSPEHSAEWASEFSPGGPRLHLESDWRIGRSVLWKDDRGTTVVGGRVTAEEHGILLAFSVLDVRRGSRPGMLDVGITFKLTQRGDLTTLWVSQGDFAGMDDGARYRDLTDRIWDAALVKIRRRAEAPAQ